MAQPTDETGMVIVDDDDRLRFLEGREGDHLVTPFQCDTCHFRNIMKRDPVASHASDIRMLKLIRRANLDAMWSTEPNTVSNTLREARRGLRIAGTLGFRTNLFGSMGPFPLEDSFGMGPAIVMLETSLNPGKNAETVQFSTIRKFRSAFSNIYQASARGQDSSVLAKDTRKMVITKCSTYGTFFEKFTRGCHKRMGDIVRPDRALSVEILCAIMHLLERDWLQSLSDIDRWWLSLEGTFYLVAFCCALRGEEVPLVDLTGVQMHFASSIRHSTPHTIVALLGRFKNETGDSNYHLLPIVSVTQSGLEPRR